MACNSTTSLVRGRTNLGLLWLLVPVGAILSTLKSYFALQLLSAVLLFAVFFLMCVALIAAFLTILAMVDHIFRWAAVALASIWHSVQFSFSDVGMWWPRDLGMEKGRKSRIIQ